MTDKISSTAARVRDLKLSPTMVDSAYAHLGGLPRDPRLVEILEQFWPDCHQSQFGNGVIMSPDKAEKLEALYKMFGVPMLVSENSLQVLGRAYDVFCLGFGNFVNHKLRFPQKFGQCQSFREYLAEWPEEWVLYIETVAAEDFENARKWAVELQVLSPDCVYPDSTHIKKPDSAPTKE